MLKRSFIKLAEKSQPEAVKELLSLPLNEGIKNAYKSNQDLLDEFRLPYELRGEYTPRRPINAFKRKPMSVIYDQNVFQQFVLPSRREDVHGGIDVEKLFGVKRWRNDSPFIKEYIKIDNQIVFICILATLLYMIFSLERHRRVEDLKLKILLEDKAVFTSNDLI